jgi:hypothetical protein
MTKCLLSKQTFLSAVVSLLFIVAKPHQSLAQVSPPGLSGTKVVGWGALGFNQALNNRLALIVYAGGARMSDPDSWSALDKQAIAVYNQEFQYKFNKKWQASLAQSFRYQNEYEDNEPYHEANPAYRYEVRYYGRLYYRHELGSTSVNYSFRPEFRTFYQPGWVPEEMPLELRFRVRAQFSIPINESKTSLFVTGNEFLSALDEFESSSPREHHHTWSSYHFTEDRLHIYFKHIFKKPRVAVNVGVMEQFKTNHHLTATSYFAFDIQFQNPFSRI